MLMTTTPLLEGFSIKEYRGIVFGEVISGMDVVSDLAENFRNFFGGRSDAYEESLTKARSAALKQMQKSAAQKGANAVVGVQVTINALGGNNGMLMVSASGTAVRVEKNVSSDAQ